MEIDRLQVVAYHEAGHAVIHLIQGLSIGKVSIIPDGHTDGRVTDGPGGMEDIEYDCLMSDSAKKRIARKDAIASFAGELAECELTGEKPSDEIYDGSGDKMRIYDVLTRFDAIPGFSLKQLPDGSMEESVDDTWVEHWKKLRKKARRLVKQNWLLIHVLAGELIKQGELSERQVRGICQLSVFDTRGECDISNNIGKRAFEVYKQAFKLAIGDDIFEDGWEPDINMALDKAAEVARGLIDEDFDKAVKAAVADAKKQAWMEELTT